MSKAIIGLASLARKSYNHELDIAWLQSHVSKDAAILDYGCGYGRLVKQLNDLGYAQVQGMDSAAEMIAVGKKRWGLENISHHAEKHIPLPDDSVDIVLLFAVLTCIPQSGDQQRLINEIQRILTPNGRIYISDLLLNEDKRNLNRYIKGENKFGTYRIFELTEGAVCRHHDLLYLKEKLLASFTIEHEL